MLYPINNRAIYKTWILVTLWVLEVLAEIVIIGVNAYFISALAYLLSYSSCVYSYYTNTTYCSDIYDIDRQAVLIVLG